MLQLRDPIELHGFDQASMPVQRQQRHSAFERLVCAAICNSELAETLLSTPELAFRKYDVGRSLSEAERRIVLSIDGAEDIHEFAGMLLARLHQAPDSRRAPNDEHPLELPRAERATRELRAAPAAAALVM